jgi:uncharacterized protein YdhG (YjbR/CyaY superfamily)
MSYQEVDQRMTMRREQYATIDEYIRDSPTGVREILERMRAVIHEAAPHAEEAIRYGMPTFRLRGRNLVFFAAFQHHIGFYPIPSGIEAFKEELSVYKQGKGSVRFPLDQPVPYDLVKRITLFRVAEVEKDAKIRYDARTRLFTR